jgi:O-acetylserine/cysteine efflux transporter
MRAMPRRHIALALSVAALWGVNFVAIDYALESFPPLLLCAMRFTLVAFPAVLVLPRSRASTPACPPGWPRSYCS